jgi:hypothetical protein
MESYENRRISELSQSCAPTSVRQLHRPFSLQPGAVKFEIETDLECVMAYDDHREEADRLVVGAREVDANVLSDNQHATLVNFYNHPLFFVPSGPLLRTHVKTIMEAFESLPKRKNGAPRLCARADLNAIANSRPVTLSVALRIDRSMDYLERHATPTVRKELCLLVEDPRRQITGETAAASVSVEGLRPSTAGRKTNFYRVPTLGIVPSLLLIDREQINYVAGRSGSGRTRLSQLVFGMEFHATLDLITSDRFRVTRHYAQRVATNFQRALKDAPGLVEDDMAEHKLFSFDLEPKKKETALLHPQGNVIPGLVEYKMASGKN